MRRNWVRPAAPHIFLQVILVVYRSYQFNEHLHHFLSHLFVIWYTLSEQTRKAPLRLQTERKIHGRPLKGLALSRVARQKETLNGLNSEKEKNL